MIGTRSLHSLAQFLELQRPSYLAVLWEKHGLPLSDRIRLGYDVLGDLLRALNAADEPRITGLLDEVGRTSRDLRKRASTMYRYDERFADLVRCLELDGYALGAAGLVPVDPSIAGSPPLEDDLTRELNGSGLPNAADVVRKMNDSAEAFRAATPDYNASLNNARVALQTLATDIADAQARRHPATFDRTKWGAVISYLRTSGFITVEEEEGLAGVFRFVSPGSRALTVRSGSRRPSSPGLVAPWLRGCAGSW
jgi:hypothetical protein